MLPIRNPFLWLVRWRHRKGYGIHSPFAYNLVTQVLYTPGRYYADDRLDGLFPWWERYVLRRRLVCHRLLFRLANYWQPREIHVPADVDGEVNSFLHAGCKHARLIMVDDEVLNYVGNRGRMVVVQDLSKHARRWRQIVDDPRVTVSFDLGDMGVAFFLPRMEKQHYIINW